MTVKIRENMDGLVSGGPMVGIDMSVSGGKMERISYAPNMVRFGHLASSVPVPDMGVPEVGIIYQP